MRNAAKRPTDPLPWALLDSRGRKALEGRGVPPADKILETLAAAGYRTTWERREAFLREHPEQGEAWLDLAQCGFRLAQLRIANLEGQGTAFSSRLRSGQRSGYGSGDSAVTAVAVRADEIFKEMADGLEGLMRVPQWTRCRADFLRMGGLGPVGAGESPRVRGIAERMRPEMLEAWRREPKSARRILGEGWVNLGEFLGSGEGSQVPWELRPQPPPPAFEPLRLVRFGKADWAGRWEALRFSVPLVPWGPEELRWESAAETTVLQRERLGWSEEPRWALFQGETMLASELACPSAQALAERLAMGGLTQLQRLDERLSRDPGNLDVRRERFSLQLSRMPQPVLEWNLAEDARLAWIPLPFRQEKAWHPDPDLWANAALKVLPELEEAIRHWPSQPAFWKAWVSWAAFHPRHPSVLNMAQQVELWGSKTRWIVGLPREVHEAVAEALRSQADFEAMRQWFQEARTGLGQFPQNLRDREAWMEAAQPIFGFLREALVKLHRDANVVALDREWQVFTRLTAPMRR